MTTAHAPLQLSTCLGYCAAAPRQPVHHDRLLRVDTDADALLDLLEIAVTWHELDYTEAPVLGPEDWLTFAQSHVWHHPQRAERIFSLAVDIVGRATCPAPPESALAQVIELVRS